MRKIICDRCGAEIPKDARIGYVAVAWQSPTDGSILENSPYEGMDFCEKCIKDIVSVIDFKILSAPEAEEPDQEEEEVVERIQKTPSKKSVDKGKVGALSKAGWSNAKIADEMGVSSERIRQILKELEVKNG